MNGSYEDLIRSMYQDNPTGIDPLKIVQPLNSVQLNWCMAVDNSFNRALACPISRVVDGQHFKKFSDKIKQNLKIG